MLGKMDDYFIHQIADTIDHVADGDPRFQDRLYFNVHGRPGDFVLGCGLGVFPNQNVMDGFVCAVRNGRQHNIRLARPLSNDRAEMFAGPLTLDIVRPMEEWRMRLGPNDYGIEFDLTFRARSAPFEHRPIFRRVDKHVNWHQQHLQQSGVYEGWIRIDGKEAPSDGLWGSRDRSWGVRGPMPGTPVPPSPHRPPGAWLSAQFEKCVVHGWFGKDAIGATTHVDGAVSATADGHGPHFVDWRYEVAPPGAELRLVFACEDGGEEVLDVVRPILARNTDGGGYYSGFFGTKRAALHLEGEVWDLDEAFVKERGAMHGEVLCEFRRGGETGFGVFQSHMLARGP